MDDFHKESVTGHGVPGARVEGAFEPIDWRWDGTVICSTFCMCLSKRYCLPLTLERVLQP